MEGETMVEIYN